MLNLRYVKGPQGVSRRLSAECAGSNGMMPMLLLLQIRWCVSVVNPYPTNVENRVSS